MQDDLGIDPIGWGWVTGMFTVAYCLFEIPTGMMGDRLGPRRVLTRIVVWWSAFTALTGAMTSFYPLLLTRFLFGAGEAGAFPNASVVVSRWFPPRQRATMSGVILMASQIGGAIAPLLVVPIQMRYGWRMSFYVFGVAGLAWAAVWYAWFRDSPEEKRGLASPSSTAADSSISAAHGFPWRVAYRSRTVWAMLGARVLLHLRLQLFPDVVPHVPRPGPGIQRGQPDAFGASVRGRRLRQPRRGAPRATPWCAGSVRNAADESLAPLR